VKLNFVPFPGVDMYDTSNAINPIILFVYTYFADVIAGEANELGLGPGEMERDEEE
jgi:hypothetical protein